MVNKKTNKSLKNLYLGNYNDSENINKILEKELNKNEYEILKNIDFGMIAELIANGETLARRSGRMEFGARALGNRSILCDPSNPDIVRKINVQI